jgi:hypothetical protein
MNPLLGALFALGGSGWVDEICEEVPEQENIDEGMSFTPHTKKNIKIFLAHCRAYHSNEELLSLMKSSISAIKSSYNRTHDGFRFAKGVKKDDRITVGEIYAFSVAAAIFFDLLKGNQPESKHKIAIGVMAPAVQDCGKNLIRMVWQACGHQVIDFGKNAKPKKCFERILENGISVLGISIMVNDALSRLRALLKLISENRTEVSICLGGMSINRLITHELSLDSYAFHVREYLSECWELLDNNNGFRHNENFKYLWLEFNFSIYYGQDINDAETVLDHALNREIIALDPVKGVQQLKLSKTVLQPFGN